MFRTIFSTTLSLLLCLSLAVPSFAATSETNNSPDTATPLSAEQIQSRLIQIDKKYSVGDILSPSDAAFIKLYTNQNVSIKPVVETGTTNNNFISNKISINKGTKHFNKTKKVAGRKVNVKGSISSHLGLVNNSFGGNYTTTVKSGKAFSTIKNHVYTSCYGLAGQGGVGKVYSGSITSTTHKSKKNTIHATKRFVASVAYASTWAQVTLYTSTGTYTIQ